MYAAKRHFFSIDDFAVAAFIDFAAAMCTNIKTGLDGDGYKFSKPLKQAAAEFFAFLG